MATGEALDGMTRAGTPHVRSNIGALTNPKWGARLFAREFASILVVMATAFSHGGTYVLSPERTTMEGSVQAGAAVSGNSDTCTITVPDGMYARVSLSDNGFRWHHCQRSSFRAYVNGAKLTLGDSVTVEGNATMDISMTAVADKWCNPYNVVGTVSVAGVQFPHYHPSYHPYTDYYAVQNYSVSVSYYRKLPDLHISGISFAEDAVAVDEKARLTFTVRNGGRLAAGSTSVVRVFDGARQVGDDVAVEALASGASSSRSVELPTLAAGNHAIRVVVDASGLVEESAEENNEATASLRVYERTEVGVTFDLNGGGKSATVSVIAGDVMAALPSVERSGYDFLGWWTSATDGSEISEKEKITQPRTFYARWRPHTTSITFNRRGGSEGTRTATATYDAALPAITSPTRTGYDFGGYWTEPGGGEQVYSADGTGISPWRADQREATLFAKWTGRTVKFTLERQGGEGGSSSITATYGEALPGVSVPTRKNWVFQGYFANANGEGVRYYNADGSGATSVVEAEDMALYAHWLPVNMECELRLNVQGGTGATSVKATYGQVFPAVAVPVREGYAFKGYFSEPGGGGTQYSNADGTGATLWDGAVPLTLYAKWERAYRIVLDPNGGTGSRLTHYFTEPAWKLAANTFTNSGRVFAGWALEPDGAPVYPDEAILSKELLDYGDDPDAASATLYAAWGMPLSTGLFPGFSFVTGGSGENGGWKVVNGKLASADQAGHSWLCVLLEGGGHLECGWSVTVEHDAVATLVITSPLDVNVITNVCGVSESLLPGRHLVTRSYNKPPLSLYWANGGVDVSSEEGLRRQHTELQASLDELSDEIIGLMYGELSGAGSYNEQAARRILVDAIDEYRQQVKHGLQHYLLQYHLVDTWAHAGYDVSYVNRAIENHSLSGDKIINACDNATLVIKDIVDIENYMEAHLILDAVSFMGQALVCFVQDDASQCSDAIKAEISKRQLERQVDALTEKISALMYGELCGAGRYNEQDAKRILVDAVDEYRQLVEHGLQHYLLQYHLVEAWAHAGYDVSYVNRAIENHSLIGDKIIKACDNAALMIDGINTLELYVGECGVMEMRTVLKECFVGELPTPEEREGYTFQGWFDENGEAVGENTKVSRDMIVHGKWSLNRYRVLFDTNGGTAVEAQIVEHGERVALPAAPTREGYVFEGWYRDNNGNVAVDGNITAVSDATLYALWTKDAPVLQINKTPTSYFKWGESDGSSSGGIVHAGRFFAAFAKAQVARGCLHGANGKVVGKVDVKAGKVSKKGMVKISATATLLVNGKAKNVSAKAVSTKLDANGRISPVALTFSKPIGRMSFEMGADGVFTLASPSYAMAQATVGGALKGGARGTFRLEGFNLAVPGTLQDDLLPYEEPFKVAGAKWQFAKAAAVKWAKDRKTKVFGRVVDESKGKTNRSGLKLTYAAKTGVFKGSFKAYSLQNALGGKKKMKTYKVDVVGFVVDGVGTGEASCKRPAGGPWAVTVE